MSAIEFVVRGGTGTEERGAVSGSGGDASIILGSGQDLSLNLGQGDVLSYVRQGQALQITLVNGQVITVQGFFGADGAAENELFVSANGALSQVDLSAGDGNLLYAQYIEADSFGKWSPDDDLYFVRGSDVMVAGVEAANAEAGMLFTPLMGGLGGIGAAAGIAGAGLGVAAIAAGGGDGTDTTGGGTAGGGDGGTDPEPELEVEITGGTQSAGHTVDAEDYADGITVSGTGTPGATGVVTINEVSTNVEVDGQGQWSATFTTDELPEGEYEAGVTITVTDGELTASASDVLVVDTVADVSVEVETVETDGVINSEEETDGFTLTGSTQEGSSVVVTIDGTDYDATVTGSGWSVDLPGGVIAGGEYDLEVTVTATDEHGNSASTVDTIPVDTITSLTLDASGAGGDGTVNQSEHAAGVMVNGVAESNASVVVTFAGTSQTIQAGADGSWSATFASADVPTGTLEVPVTAVSTDAAGNTATATGSVQIDTELHATVATASVETDGTINATEHADGVTLTGTSQAGARVSITFGSGTRTVTADANGNWTADWATSEVPTGETQAAVNVTATDAAGNTATASGTVQIDTVMNVSVETATVEGDGVVNAMEHANGVTLTGTSQANAQVSVTFGTGTRTVTADANGNWSADWATSELPTGETDANVSVTATDAAGNVATTSGTVAIDTVTDVSVDTSVVAGDGVVNGVEHANGITLTGASAGADTVLVTLGNVTHTATVAADGSWTVDFADGEFASGELDVAVTVQASDAAGNTDIAYSNVTVDTFVNELASAPGRVEGDDIVNNAEASDGIVLNGVVEQGSSVMVTFEGTTRAATVDTNGNWSVTFAGDEIESGTYDATVTINATDAAGNTAQITDTFHVDTIAPDAANIESVTTADNVTRGFSMVNVETGTSVDVTEYANSSDDAATDVSGGSFVNPINQELQHIFDSGAEVPDGSHLVVTTGDAAGNTNSTLLVLDEDGNSVVDMNAAALSDFNIGAIDLEYAEDSALTLSVADLEALSGNDNSLTIHGGIDDHVTLNGTAQITGTTTIDGQDYNVFTVGDNGGELIINQDIDFNQSVI